MVEEMRSQLGCQGKVVSGDRSKKNIKGLKLRSDNNNDNAGRIRTERSTNNEVDHRE